MMRITIIMGFLHVMLQVPIATTAGIVAKPGCDDHCGNVSIPYPFGMTKGCYLNEDFIISCDKSSNPPRPYFGENLNVTKISVLEGQLHVLQFIAYDCYDKQNMRFYNQPWLKFSKFTISDKQNKFMAVGCDTYAIVRGFQLGNQVFTTGCMSICESIQNVRNGSCSGVGCCQISIPNGLRGVNLTLSSYKNHADVMDFNPCSYAFVVEQTEFNFSSNYFQDLRSITGFPVVVDWTIGEETCEVAHKNLTGSYACKSNNSDCSDPDNASGYRCSCKEGYQGNPYLDGGCQDLDECANRTLNTCKQTCHNIDGSYWCSCPKGYHGDGRTDGEGCVVDQAHVIKLAVGIAAGVTVVLVGSSWLYFGFKKRKLMRFRRKCFEQNGGRELEKKTTIFTEEELKKATTNYDDSRIMRRVGSGTVYKGELAEDKIVAIKKFKIVDESFTKEFINEVDVLSQINHRNVVKLLGCCLETKIPLLVFEFVNNRNLFQHIHNDSSEESSTLSWDKRLRIATETAGALSYLHSEASTIIIHGDVKSANILLDDQYTAKVSEFGVSMSVPLIDQAQLSTIVQGGSSAVIYLDPESVQTGKVTEKSDVYSFGIVLVELLTGRKEFSSDKSKARTLATLFLSSLKENRLSQVLEDYLVRDAGITEQLVAVANLAMRCLNVKGDERPTMKEVATELEGLRRKHPSINNEESTTQETESLPREKSDVGTNTS